MKRARGPHTFVMALLLGACSAGGAAQPPVEPGTAPAAPSGQDAPAATTPAADDPAEAEELGRRARERVLEEHTFADRANRLLALLGVGAAAAPSQRAASPS